jgi:hypothetical protein
MMVFPPSSTGWGQFYHTFRDKTTFSSTKLKKTQISARQDHLRARNHLPDRAIERVPSHTCKKTRPEKASRTGDLPRSRRAAAGRPQAHKEKRIISPNI